MHNRDEVIVNINADIVEAIRILDSSALQIVLVVNEDGKLVGTVTDGDVRRALLRGISLEEPVEKIMNKQPITVDISAEREQVLFLLRHHSLKHVPVLDCGKVAGLHLLADFLAGPHNDNWVVLMAGGLGSRLGDITKNCPKPLLDVGGKPLLETIIENFRENGFSNFFLSVNYKAEMISSYFGDGSQWDICIQYLQENKKMGTAGALSLLPERPDKPFIVMNGDLLTKVNFQQLLDFHREHKAKATMCVREYRQQVPYGVVSVEEDQLVDIVEKPVEKYFVNGGIYVLEPEVLNFVPKDEYIDMPVVFEKLLQKGMKIAVFPIREYWLDIGQRGDLERAIGEYGGIFGCQ